MSFIKIIQSKFLILITLILAILGFFLYNTSTRKINFNPEKIARIEVFSKERKIKDINSPNKIDDIVKILQQLRSRTESVNDFPNLEKYYLLKTEKLNVYIYENDKKYYVEVPYNAIYLLNTIQYNKLLEIVK
ncbi:DUF5301 domain-containing protein [Leptotrichia buccalis]|uniref:DUF5301 domain-containing protein n=1 Tax=Leptotrichia buccalis (strain ATCC 14201 / DSM 1135 / JCM 12969 / NCTC 10249 / C-1013-b) TaxID=523794 RepID=C7N9A7_LEPBD|nr:DUF5301 domain-containing protein [Leptotrichia buccalis]ACV38738.1 hypothetical protein Lebu_0830 [Leptotrichia buccalis C-1013-b]